RLFTTSYDHQTSVKIQVCQGESRRFEENTPLGELVLDGLAAKRRGEVAIGVTFEINTDGILRVHAKDPATGNATAATSRVLGTMSEEEIKGTLETAHERRVVSDIDEAPTAVHR